MGLDQYLYAVNKVAGDATGKIDSERIYLSDDDADKVAKAMQKERKELYSTEEFQAPYPKPGRWYHQDGVMQAAYWRKVNAVHAWFVREVQGGVDDCGAYIVHPEKLAELYTTIKDVLEDPSTAPELLPSQPGFFFGSVDYDEWYFNDLRETITMLDAVKDDPRCQGKTLVYTASW